MSPGAWVRGRWVLRRFKHWQRPRSMAGDRAERSVALLTRALGPWHAGTMDAREKLRHWVREDGDPAAALRLARAEIAARTAVFGAEHRATLDARRELIRHLNGLGDPAAITEARALAEDMGRVLGPDHGETLAMRRTFAYTLRDGGQVEAAVQAFTDLLAELEAAERVRPAELRSTWIGLAYTLERHGDRERALVYVEREIAAERGTVYPPDEDFGHHLKMLLEWRDRLRRRPYRR